MNRSQLNLKRKYQAVLAYYRQTVWNQVNDIPLGGAQYAVARRAWERLDAAHRAWFCKLDPSQWAQAGEAEPNIGMLEPSRLEKDDAITPERLATIASARLGTTKPKSIHTAVEEAHKILLTSRNYLKALPEPKKTVAVMLESYFSPVAFSEIINSVSRSGEFALLPPVQAKRNNGKLSQRALEQTLKRYAANSTVTIKQEIREALKNKKISFRLLEEIRWNRFRNHFNL